MDKIQEVAKLVAKGISVNKSCKQVAVYMNDNHGTSIKPDSLRQVYIRYVNKAKAIKPADKKIDTRQTSNNTIQQLEDKVTQLEDIITDLNNTITKLEEEKETLTDTLDNATKDPIVKREFDDIITTKDARIKELTKILEGHADEEAARVEAAKNPAMNIDTEDIKPASTALPRETAINYIADNGSAIQKAAISTQTINNGQLLNMFIKTREDVLSRNHPSTIPTNILSATAIQQ